MKDSDTNAHSSCCLKISCDGLPPCCYHISEGSIYLKLIQVRNSLICPITLRPKYSRKTHLQGDVLLKKIVQSHIKLSTLFLYPPLLLILLFISLLLLFLTCPFIHSSSSFFLSFSRFHWTSSVYILFFSSLSFLNPPPLPFSYVYHSFVLFFILSLIIIFFILISVIFSVWKKDIKIT